MERAAALTGLGMAIPDQILTNRDLEQMVDTSDEWIRERTGIRERHIATEETTVSDLAFTAAEQALQQARVEAGDVDLVIVATVTPDMPFPATACIVAERLGLNHPASFDLEAGCSGFVYALAAAQQFIVGGMYDTVLVIGSEILSRITDWEDRNTCVLFGDGAGAAVLQAHSEQGLLAFDLGSDGAGGDFLKVEAGGSLLPASEETVRENKHKIRMDGREVFRFAVKTMGESAQRTINKAGLRQDDIELFIPHQANTRIIEAAARRIGLGQERVFVNLPYYGNTSSASIPIALKEAVDSGRVRYGDNVIMVGFGAGLTWASVLLRWTKKEEYNV